MINQYSNQEKVFPYLKEAKTIAVVGLSTKEAAVSYQVSKQMQAAGYRIIPVNPGAVDQTILGERVYARLTDIEQPIDIVNVFRKSEYLVDVASDFVQTDARVFWAQLGLESQEAADLLQAAGREDIVMNRCIKVDYLALKDSLSSEGK